MNDDPFLALLLEALNLTHPRFALANGREYTPSEADEPPAARKFRERSFVMEFYHEFRRLWDKAVPIQRGLGHIIIQAHPDEGSRTPDLLFWKLGENGNSDQRLAAISFAFLSNPGAVNADQALLKRFQFSPGYPRAISVVIGPRGQLPGTGIPTVGNATLIFFDIDKWQATIE